MQDLLDHLRQFNAERDWHQFHSPKNLSMAVAVEAAELMEHFQWLTEEESRLLTPSQCDQAKGEVADVMLYLLTLADQLGIDLLDAARAKLTLNRQRYPSERARGKAAKYTAYLQEQTAEEVAAPDSARRGDAASTLVAAVNGVAIRRWVDHDWSQVRRLALQEGWASYRDRPRAALEAWGRSDPALVAVDGDAVVGFLRALTDGALTMYVGELLVAESHRRRGIARALLNACHRLYPDVRLDLLAAEDSRGFYQRTGFRAFPGYRKSGAEFDAS